MNEIVWMKHTPVADPINSIAELVVEVCLDIPDTQTGDERDAESEQFSGFQVTSSFVNSSMILQRKNFIIVTPQLRFYNSSIPSGSAFAVISPPPEGVV